MNYVSEVKFPWQITDGNSKETYVEQFQGIAVRP